MKKILLAVAILLAWSTLTEARQDVIKLRATGYHITGYKSKQEAKVEGGKKDRWGNPLRPLQNYIFGSFVSVATDPSVIKSGTVLTIDEFPGVIFLACDVGSGVIGRTLDICCLTKDQTHELPKRITARKITYIKNAKKCPNYGFGYNIALK